jgi:hypothetical protein
MDEESTEMFPGILSSMGQVGPKSSNLVAEPAQVMVLVPGTRAKQAESSLASLKMYIYLFAFFVLMVLIAIAYYYYRKKPKYEGRELPGAYEPKIKVPELAKQEPIPERLDDLVNDVVVDDVVDNVYDAFNNDDIVDVYGEIPVWSTNDDIAPIENDEKVSENSAEINALIKSREQLTQHFEKMISKGSN